MLRIVLCLFLVAASTCHQYSPFCQGWCNGQQPTISPQLCGTYCGGYDPCSSGYPYPYPYPLNPTFPDISLGVPFPETPVLSPFPGTPGGGIYPGTPGGGFFPGPLPSFPGAAGGGVFPGYPGGWPGGPEVNPNPNIPVTTDPIKVVVSTTKEWICPVDPQPRAGQISGALPPKLVACDADENCESSPVRQKCCYDQGINDKVCKPAVLA